MDELWTACPKSAAYHVVEPALTSKTAGHSVIFFPVPCLANEKTPKGIDLDKVKVVVGPAMIRIQIFCQHVILPAGGGGRCACLLNELPDELLRTKHFLCALAHSEASLLLPSASFEVQVRLRSKGTVEKKIPHGLLSVLVPAGLHWHMSAWVENFPFFAVDDMTLKYSPPRSWVVYMDPSTRTPPHEQRRNDRWQLASVVTNKARESASAPQLHTYCRGDLISLDLSFLTCKLFPLLWECGEN